MTFKEVADILYKELKVNIPAQLARPSSLQGASVQDQRRCHVVCRRLARAPAFECAPKQFSRIRNTALHCQNSYS